MFSGAIGGARAATGMTSDSSRTCDDSLDWPCARSTKMIGTSPMRQPRAARLEEHLDEERVAVRDHAVERQARERLAPPAAEAARAVARRQPRDRADVAVRERAEKDPVQRPVHDADAVQIARADHEVVVAARPRAPAGTPDRARGRRPSGRSDRRRSCAKRVLQAVDVRASEPAWAGAVHHFDAARDTRAASASAICTGAIRRAVVDDQHAEAVVGEDAARPAPAGCRARCTSGQRRARRRMRCSQAQCGRARPEPRRRSASDRSRES